VLLTRKLRRAKRSTLFTTLRPVARLLQVLHGELRHLAHRPHDRTAISSPSGSSSGST